MAGDIPWKWRTRSGMIRAKEHIHRYRKNIARSLITKLNSSSIEYEVYRTMKLVLAAYRLSSKDSTSVKLLTELDIIYSSEINKMEKNFAIMRQWDLVHQESFKGLDPVIESDDGDSPPPPLLPLSPLLQSILRNATSFPPV